jgi:hypothetical protein
VTSSVELVGAEQAFADMARWAAEVGPAVVKAAGPFAQHVADTVAGRVPYLSGQLAGSVDTAEDDESIDVTMGDGVVYAGWIEFGGSRGRPYIPEGRYLYPTALESQDEFAQVAADAAADTVGRFSWSTPSS